MKVCTIGTGYVGLVTGACLADIGHRVMCLDIDSDKINQLKEGNVPIYEPGLDDILKRCSKASRLSFSTDIHDGVRRSDIIFITVGTPSDSSGAADLIYVKDVADKIAKSINGYKVIVNKSTVPVGTTRIVRNIIEEKTDKNSEFDVVSNPEFLREGSAVEDFMHPYRIVIGTYNSKAAEIMRKLYEPLNAPILITEPESAEMIKYASNAFLATKISFINAIANICSSVGADVEEVARGMGYDKRIGSQFLQAGPGWGGSCFGKDCRALIKLAQDNQYDFHLLEGVIRVNEEQKKLIAQRVQGLVGNLEEKTIGILGLAFKPETDDMREAASITIIDYLQREGARVKAYDPVAVENAKKILKNVQFVSDPYEVAKESDAIILLTHWNEFKELDFEKIKSLMKQPIIVDTRNCLNPQKLQQMGFVYRGMGR